MGIIAQYSIPRAFTLPVNQGIVAPDTVRSQDNQLRQRLNAHDADATIHLQTSALGQRPAAGVAGRPWLTTDTPPRMWLDTGSSWAALVASVRVQQNGTTVADRPTLNFIPGTNLTISAVDNPGQDRVDVTIGAAGGVITGSGTTNRLSRWTGAGTLGDSVLEQSVFDLLPAVDEQTTIGSASRKILALYSRDLFATGNGTFGGDLAVTGNVAVVNQVSANLYEATGMSVASVQTARFTSGNSDPLFTLGFRNGAGTTINSEQGVLSFDRSGVRLGGLGFWRGAGSNMLAAALDIAGVPLQRWHASGGVSLLNAVDPGASVVGIAGALRFNGAGNGASGDINIRRDATSAALFFGDGGTRYLFGSGGTLEIGAAFDRIQPLGNPDLGTTTARFRDGWFSRDVIVNTDPGSTFPLRVGGSARLGVTVGNPVWLELSQGGVAIWRWGQKASDNTLYLQQDGVDRVRVLSGGTLIPANLQTAGFVELLTPGQQLFLTGSSRVGSLRVIGSDLEVRDSTGGFTVAAWSLTTGSLVQNGDVLLTRATGVNRTLRIDAATSQAARINFERNGAIRWYTGLGAWSGTDDYEIADFTAGIYFRVTPAGDGRIVRDWFVDRDLYVSARSYLTGIVQAFNSVYSDGNGTGLFAARQSSGVEVIRMSSESGWNGGVNHADAAIGSRAVMRIYSNNSGSPSIVLNASQAVAMPGSLTVANGTPASSAYGSILGLGNTTGSWSTLSAGSQANVYAGSNGLVLGGRGWSSWDLGLYNRSGGLILGVPAGTNDLQFRNAANFIFRNAADDANVLLRNLGGAGVATLDISAPNGVIVTGALTTSGNLIAQGALHQFGLASGTEVRVRSSSAFATLTLYSTGSGGEQENFRLNAQADSATFVDFRNNLRVRASSGASERLAIWGGGGTSLEGAADPGFGLIGFGGGLRWPTDNTHDIGNLASFRPRDVNAGRNITAQLVRLNGSTLGSAGDIALRRNATEAAIYFGDDPTRYLFGTGAALEVGPTFTVLRSQSDALADLGTPALRWRQLWISNLVTSPVLRTANAGSWRVQLEASVGINWLDTTDTSRWLFYTPSDATTIYLRDTTNAAMVQTWTRGATLTARGSEVNGYFRVTGDVRVLGNFRRPDDAGAALTLGNGQNVHFAGQHDFRDAAGGAWGTVQSSVWILNGSAGSPGSGNRYIGPAGTTDSFWLNVPNAGQFYFSALDAWWMRLSTSGANTGLTFRFGSTTNLWSDGPFAFLTEGGAAQQGRFASLLASDNYADASLVPTNGAYIKGVVNADRIDARNASTASTFTAGLTGRGSRRVPEIEWGTAAPSAARPAGTLYIQTV